MPARCTITHTHTHSHVACTLLVQHGVCSMLECQNLSLQSIVENYQTLRCNSWEPLSQDCTKEQFVCICQAFWRVFCSFLPTDLIHTDSRTWLLPDLFAKTLQSCRRKENQGGCGFGEGGQQEGRNIWERRASMRSRSLQKRKHWCA